MIVDPLTVYCWWNQIWHHKIYIMLNNLCKICIERNVTVNK